MKIFLTLLKFDLIASKRWFNNDRISKIAVIAGFFLTFSALSVFLFLYSQIFFRMIATYQEYGLMTAHYILHGAILMLLWFAVVSAVTAMTTFLFSENHSRDYLLVLPVKENILVLWNILRSVVINIFLLIFIFAPIIIAYEQIFIGKYTFLSAFQILFVLFSLVVISGSIGGNIAYFILGRFKTRNIYDGAISIIVFLFISSVLIRLIFPKELSMLYYSSPENFNSTYSQLPLISLVLPTKWLADQLVYGFDINAISLLIITLGIGFLSYRYQGKRFIRIVSSLKDHPQGKLSLKLEKIGEGKFIKTSYPLILKDIYSIIRSPSEAGYTLFLLSIIAFFFIFLRQTISYQQNGENYRVEIIIFVFGWLMFFSVAYLLRLVFPLVAREGVALWYILTLPVSKNKFFHNKLVSGFIFSFPLFVIAALLWVFLPWIPGLKRVIIFYSINGIVILSLTQTILGSIFPNFSLGGDPEKVSTSIMGFISLFISLIISGILAFILTMFLKGNITVVNLWLWMVILSLGILIPLYSLSTRLINRYYL